MGLAEVCAAVRPAVVAIGTTIDDAPIIIGTGFNVDPLGIVLTCRHVIEGLLLDKLPNLDVPAGKRFGYAQVRGRQKFAMFHHAEGDGVAVEGVSPVVIYGPKKRDAAVMMLPRREEVYPWVDIGDSDAVLEGQAIATCGYPLHLALEAGTFSGTSSFQAGIISAVLPHPDLPPIHRMSLQLDMVVNPGNSGGPVFLQETGKVIGIVQSHLFVEGSGAPQKIQTGLSYAVPINVAKPYIEKLRQNPEELT